MARITVEDCLDVVGDDNRFNLIHLAVKRVKQHRQGEPFVVDGKNKEFAMISVGYSTINRTATVDVGALMLSYGGGGHKKVGTCQVPYDSVDDILEEILETIQEG